MLDRLLSFKQSKALCAVPASGELSNKRGKIAHASLIVLSILLICSGIFSTPAYLNAMDADLDNDGMPDVWEVANGLDPASDDSTADPDHDALSNLDEYNNDTDPWKTDSDYDGIGDGTEVSMGTDPLDSADMAELLLETSMLRVTDVSPRAFSLVWISNQAATCFANVYSDPSGDNLVKGLSIIDESASHPPAGQNGVMKTKISGLNPGTNYYYRIVTISSEGILVEPASGVLPSVQTEISSTVIQNDLLIFKILQSDGSSSATGALLVGEVAGANYPITGWVGDGVPEPYAYLDLNNIYSSSDNLNLELYGGEAVTLESMGGALGYQQFNATIPDEKGEIQPLDPEPTNEQSTLWSTLPSDAEYGAITGNPNQANEVSFYFEGMSGSVILSYEAYDIDFDNEVEIFINDRFAGFASVTGNNVWGDLQHIILADKYVNNTNLNTITFYNVVDSTIAESWGVRYIGTDYQDSSIPPKEPTLWHDWFAVDTTETPMIGDFNGDGLTDIITFTRDNPLAVGDVYVALSDGTQFGDNTKWHDWFAINHDEVVVIGDYDGDGMDDIATWLRTTTKQVYVALSYGTGMEHEHVWLNSIGIDSGDLLAVGNVNGDDYDDLVLFARNQGKVYVALSDGSSFGSPQLWHDWFAVSTYERPRVGDLDGDGMADIITFATDSPTAQGDVYVAMSDGTRFGDNHKWHDWFSVEQTQIIRIGDLDGDGRDDFFTFMPPPSGQVYAVFSMGTYMSENVLLYEHVSTETTDLPFVGDVNGDGKEDIIVFRQGTGVVEVTLSE